MPKRNGDQVSRRELAPLDFEVSLEGEEIDTVTVLPGAGEVRIRCGDKSYIIAADGSGDLTFAEEVEQ